MNARKWLVPGLCVAAVLALGGLVAAARLTAGTDEPGDRDKQDAATDRRASFIAAYNRGDAKAVAAFWAPDAIYVDDDGHEYSGRTAIEKLYEKTFEVQKGAKLAIHVTSSKAVSPDVLLNEGVTEVTLPGGGPPVAERFSAVLVKQGGEWLLQSVHDSEARPPSNADRLDELEWLVGEWAGESEKGDSATAEYEPEYDGNFLVCTYSMTLDGVPVSGGTQWIGWDAIDKQVRSWTFYSGGGFGEAVWAKDGNKWSSDIRARTAAGNRATASNVITKIDDDTMSWQLTKMTVDGKTMPDLPPVKMKRVKAAQP
jgi:uncharacterized protein (TIGR02246 family)